MEFMQSILDLLNNVWVKALMVAVGTWILRAWPRFVNEAAPFWTGIYSIGTALLGGLFPGQAPTAMGEGVMFAAVAAGATPWWQSLLTTVFFQGIVPWLGGFGTARAADQTKKHVVGVRIGEDAPAKPIELKPFQALLTSPQEKKVDAAKE